MTSRKEVPEYNFSYKASSGETVGVEVTTSISQNWSEVSSKQIKKRETLHQLE